MSHIFRSGIVPPKCELAGISYLVGGQKGGELPQCTGTGPADGQCSARRKVQRSETGTRFSVMRCMTEDLCEPVWAHNRK